MCKEKEHISDELVRKINSCHIFWSFQKHERVCIADDLLIEKTLVHLDIEDIEKLFLIYPMDKVKQVWDEIQDDHCDPV
jgi:hypothetical protein